MDAYFAALEQIANPKLVGRPVVVGSSGLTRGVVSTASYESRIFGIHSGMSSSEARRLCPDAVFLGVDPDHYVSVSAQLSEIFSVYSPRVEAVSVDEAFLDVTGCDGIFGSEIELATRLKHDIRSNLGLTCSLGIAPTKIMAKLASSVFKPDGLTIIQPGDLESILYPLPVEKMWGIGPVAAEALRAAGILTIGDLAQHDLRDLRRRLGKNGEILGRIARGDDSSPVIPAGDQPEEKSIGHERTFSSDSSDISFLQATLFHLSDLVSRRMRRNGFRGRTVTVRIRHADFTTLTRRLTIEMPTDSRAVIYNVARRLFSSHWTNRTKLRLLGISVSGLVHSEESHQTELFGLFEENSARNPSQIDTVIDKIRDRFGETAIQGAFSHLGVSR